MRSKSVAGYANGCCSPQSARVILETIIIIMLKIRHLLSTFSRDNSRLRQSRWIVAHPLKPRVLKIALASQQAIDRPERLPIARRLIKAYARAKAHEDSSKLQKPEDDMWTRLIEREFKQLLQILKSEDVDELSKFLLHFGEQYTWFGGLTLSVDGFNAMQKDSSFIALTYLDKLVCLAESLGVLALENPEHTLSWGENLYVDADEILDRIEKQIGISVVPPIGAVPVTGIDTSRGPLHYRHFNSLYAALRIKALLPDSGAICEYGGGLGIVAYYANKLGFQNYTIFDLPLVNLFAGHFLMNTLGAEAVRLYGEDSQTASVNVLPYWECMTVPTGAYSLSFNQDSFPEIDPKLVLNYLQQIERTSTKYFLSINQETQATTIAAMQNSVHALIRNFKNFHQVYRMKYWIREGYVEELYAFRR
jgi:hypothetical protein